MSRDSNSFSTHGLRSPNLLPEEWRGKQEAQQQPRRKKTKFLSCFFIVLIIILTALTALIARSNNNFFVGVKNGFLVRQLRHIFTGSGNELRGEADDRINFLVLGIGGPGHEGPYLTDTIILASYKPSTEQAAMLSIPRDLIIPDDNAGYIKINHIYALSQTRGLEAAFARTKKLIGNTFGLPIHYLGVIDFEGFIKMIDAIGGITVNVDRAFTDNQFPVGPNQYQKVAFKTGKQTMDGLTALQFARSRHGNNSEGSDFARSARQQKIILATKEKLSSLSTVFNPRKITTLFGLVNQYTKADIEPWEVVKLVQMAKNIKKDNVTTIVLDDGPQGILYSGISSVDGAYILQPKGGNYNQPKTLAHNMLNNTQLAKEGTKVLILNGTLIPNLAQNVATELEVLGLKPVHVGNALRQTYLDSVLYDYTNGKKPKTKAFLESQLETDSQTNIPLELASYTLARSLNIQDEKGQYVELDFLIIVGDDMMQRGNTELIRTLTPEEIQARTATETATSTQDTATVIDDNALMNNR